MANHPNRSPVLSYIRALGGAALAFRSGDDALINETDAAAVVAEQVFDAAGKRSGDYPGVQAAEKRYHDARAQYDAAVER